MTTKLLDHRARERRGTPAPPKSRDWVSKPAAEWPKLPPALAAIEEELWQQNKAALMRLKGR